MTQSQAALCLHKSKSINHADTHHSLRLSSEKLQHSCSLWLAGYSGIKFVLVNLTISRVFSEVWQYQHVAVRSNDVLLHGMHCDPYCCNRAFAISALPASKGRSESACLHTATYFSRRVGHIDSHHSILMRPNCTGKWINDAKQLALARVQLNFLKKGIESVTSNKACAHELISFVQWGS